MTRYSKAEAEDSAAELRSLLDFHGAPIYTIIRRVSVSGMTRWITPFIIRPSLPLVIAPGVPHPDDLRYLGFHTARVLGLGLDTDHGVKVIGAGMDMCFHLVSSLSQALYGDPYRLTYRLL